MHARTRPDNNLRAATEEGWVIGSPAAAIAAPALETRLTAVPRAIAVPELETRPTVAPALAI
jgi:hypothetical protein